MIAFFRVHDLINMQEIMKIEAHDQEILCVQYSDLNTGKTFCLIFYSKSRNRKIILHMFIDLIIVLKDFVTK